MLRRLTLWFLSAALLTLVGGMPSVLLSSCAPTPAYIEDDCHVYEDLGLLRVNPAGALERHLRIQAAFKVCPPEQGLAEITRKRIELKHHAISLLSAQTVEQLQHPLRAEHLREKLLITVNEHVLTKSRVTDVFITEMELE